MKYTIGFFIFNCNITINYRLNRKLQLVGVIQYRDTSLNREALISTLNCKASELIGLANQGYILGTDGSYLLRLDFRCCSLTYIGISRSKLHILSC